MVALCVVCRGLDLLQPVHIGNVLRDPRMMFFRRIPRLGAFLAVPFKYESCDTQTSLDKAFGAFCTSSPALRFFLWRRGLVCVFFTRLPILQMLLPVQSKDHIFWGGN